MADVEHDVLVAGVTCHQDAERQAAADANREGGLALARSGEFDPTQGAPARDLRRADKVIPDSWRLAPWLVPLGVGAPDGRPDNELQHRPPVTGTGFPFGSEITCGTYFTA